MVTTIKEVLASICDLYKSNLEREEKEFELYLTRIFEGTKKIEDNYIEILTTLRNNILYDNWRGEDSLKYLLQIEYELKSERIYIREMITRMNKKYDDDLENFISGVFGIMYCGYVDRFRVKEMEHRFSRLIRYAKTYDETPCFRLDFLEEINDMLRELSSAWKIVCSEYIKLKQ